MEIKFVSYDGSWPNLCRGTLILEIDGIKCSFGNNYEWNDKLNRCEKTGGYDSFWTSGGYCAFSNNYMDSYVNKCPWIIEDDELPDFLKPYAEKISEVFNENVPYGCCGGCL